MAYDIIPDVTNVEVLEDYTLKVSFEDGVNRLFDFKPYLSWNCYAPLKNKSFFKLASIEYGTVMWPGNIDVDPELLYTA